MMSILMSIAAQVGRNVKRLRLSVTGLIVVALAGPGIATNADQPPIAVKVGDVVTTITLGNPGPEAMKDVPVTLGHLFKTGDLPAGRGLSARIKGGAKVPMQVEAIGT
jgi:hypothetical protein